MVYFVCHKLKIKYYESHLHAYVVENVADIQVVDHRCHFISITLIVFLCLCILFSVME
jgi:hypothetical protein